MRLPEAMSEITLRTLKIATVLQTLAQARRITLSGSVDLTGLRDPWGQKQPQWNAALGRPVIPPPPDDHFETAAAPYRAFALALGSGALVELEVAASKDMSRKLGEWKYAFSHDVFVKTHSDPTDKASFAAVTARIPLERVLKLNMGHGGTMAEWMIAAFDTFLKEHVL